MGLSVVRSGDWVEKVGGADNQNKDAPALDGVKRLSYIISERETAIRVEALVDKLNVLDEGPHSRSQYEKLVQHVRDDDGLKKAQGGEVKTASSVVIEALKKYTLDYSAREGKDGRSQFEHEYNHSTPKRIAEEVQKNYLNDAIAQAIANGRSVSLPAR